MTSLHIQHCHEVVHQLHCYSDRHSKSHDDASFFDFEVEPRNGVPAGELHDAFVDADFAPGDVCARNYKGLCGRFVGETGHSDVPPALYRQAYQLMRQRCTLSLDGCAQQGSNTVNAASLLTCAAVRGAMQ